MTQAGRPWTFRIDREGWIVRSTTLGERVLAELGIRAAGELCDRRHGLLVRDRPLRWTARLETRGAGTCFLKAYLPGAGREGRIHPRKAPAEVEFEALRSVAALGVEVPTPLLAAWTNRGGRGASFCLLAAMPGEGSLEDMLCGGGHRDELERWILGEVPPLLRRLHGAGLVHRDLYPGHLWLVRGLKGAPGLIDLARVRRRTRRAWIKDLASLQAGLTPYVGEDLRARLLERLLPAGAGRGLRRAVAAKAARILRHAPRHDPPLVPPDRPGASSVSGGGA